YLNGSIAPDEVASVHELLGFARPCSPDDHTLAAVWEIVRCGPQLSAPNVEFALAKLRKPLTRDSDPAQMLTTEHARALVRHGIAIGAHGKTHTAFPLAIDLAAELREPRRVLENVLAGKAQVTVNALSFPHGAHTSDIIDQAFQEGYRIVFTSQEELSPVSHGCLRTPVSGRINVSGPSFAPRGRLRPDFLAFHFFRRPHANPNESRCYPRTPAVTVCDALETPR